MSDHTSPTEGGRWVSDEAHRLELERGSGVRADVASAAGLWSEGDAAELSRMTGIPRKAWTDDHLPALVFPYQAPDEREPSIFRVKPKKPLAFNRPDGAVDLRKYVQPKGEGVRLYFPPSLRDSERRRRDPSLSLLITEGEKKTLAAESAGLLCIGLSGVSCWSKKSGRKRVLHDDFAHLELRERRVFVVFDSDASTNLLGVRREEAALCRGLRAAGAVPHVVRLPAGPGGAKQGLDDFLVARGAEALRELCRAAKPAAELREVPSAPPEGTALTDLGNAERLVRAHGADLRWVGAWARWLVWDGRRWSLDDTGETTRRASATVRAIYQEAADCSDPDRRQKLAEHARRSESARALSSMLTLARSMPGISIVPDALDADPWALNVRNGTLDLRTGELREHRREDLITKLAPVEHEKDACAPTWEAFLDRTFAGNQAVIDFVRRAAGYTLTGLTGEQKLFVGYGTGANGKSTFLGGIEDVLGPYARQTAPELLVERGDGKRSESHPTEVADLQGVRCAICTELAQDRALAEGLVKRLTGERRVKARFMRQDFFEFTATHKLWVGTNHRPNVRGTDEAIWRRMILLPFTVTIPPEERDPDLPEKLRAEASGILAWALRGCLEWQQGGLREPPDVVAATEEYRADSDILRGFLDSSCVILPGVSAWARDLYAAYSEWCEESGEHAVTQTTFGIRLRERGLTRKRGKGGAYRWHGITLRPEDERKGERLNGGDGNPPLPGPFARKGGERGNPVTTVQPFTPSPDNPFYDEGTDYSQGQGSGDGRRF